MEKNLRIFTNPGKALLLLCWLAMVIPLNSQAAKGDKKDCSTNCFQTQVLEIVEQDNCKTYTLEVSYEGDCHSDLSHYTIEVPCGNITHAENSEGWAMELNVLDPKTQLYGLKVDDISSFGKDKGPETFTVTYTVCAEDESCRELLDEADFKVAYKAATCVDYEDIDVNPEEEEDAEEDSTDDGDGSTDGGDGTTEDPLSATAQVTNILCAGDANGAISLSVAGGMAPYQYSWNTGAESASLENLAQGAYEVTVKDAAGEAVTVSVQIDAPEAISAEGQLTHIACGSESGSIALNITGGVAPYSVDWSNGATGAELSGLLAGTYSATITDANQCSTTAEYTITESASSLGGYIEASTSLACNEEGQGYASATVWGGGAPYTYLWSNGATTASVNNLNSGSYSVVITDSNGCSITRTANISIKNVFITSRTTSPLCPDESNASIDVTVNNGTAPYTFLWSNGATTEDLSGIAPGVYVLSVTDANGCTATKNIMVANAREMMITGDMSIQDCNDTQNAAIDLSVSVMGGQSPYSYVWFNGATSESITVDQEGAYDVTITDANGCSKLHTLNVARPAEPISVSEISTDLEACAGAADGTVLLTVSGGVAPYSYEWSDGVKVKDRRNLSAGTHTVTVTDAIGCSVSKAYTVTETEAMIVDVQASNVVCEGEVSSADITVSVSGGAAPYTYYWSTGAYTQNLTGVPAGEYIIYVTDINYCTVQTTVLVECPSDPDSGDGTDNPDTGDGTDNPDTGDGTDNPDTGDGTDNPDTGDGTDNPDTGDGTDNPDSGDGTDNPDTGDATNCETGFETEIISIVGKEGCYEITLEVTTDGTARHALSHYSVEVTCGQIMEVTNTEAWPIEVDLTDPTTGLYGFKVDETEGFGDDGSTGSFLVTYTVCSDDPICLDDLSEGLKVAYKAGQCVYYETLSITYPESSVTEMSILAYPNPFESATAIEFKAANDESAKLELFDINGNRIGVVFEGELEAGSFYRFNLDMLENYDGNVVFYLLTTESETQSGRLFKQ